MEIVLKNSELEPSINFLSSMNLRASSSRHIAKLKIKLNEAIEGLVVSQMALLEEYGEKDESGKLIQSESPGQYKLKKESSEDYQKEFSSLMKESATIESGLYTENFEKILAVLNSYDDFISGKNVEIYDRLMDEFEKNSTSKAADNQ